MGMLYWCASETDLRQPKLVMYEIYTRVLGVTATPMPGNMILTKPDVPGADVATAVRTRDELKDSTVTVALQRGGLVMASTANACSPCVD